MGGVVAVVTGGLTGIGLASAMALKEAGHTVAVCSRQGGDELVADKARSKLGSGRKQSRATHGRSTLIQTTRYILLYMYAVAQLLVDSSNNCTLLYYLHQMPIDLWCIGCTQTCPL